MNGETIGSRMRGWYVSGGYDIMTLIRPSSGHYLAPFAQYEQFNTQDRVADGFTADPANDRSVLTLGLVYKPHPNVAIKGDFRDNRNKAGTAVDQWNIAVAYLF